VYFASPSLPPSLSSNVELSARAYDNVGVASVQFKLNGSKLGPALTPTASGQVVKWTWDTTTVADGRYTLSVVATDTSGNVSVEPWQSVTVANAPQPPDDDDGLVAAYSFDEGAGTTARDSSGNDRDGTLIGARFDDDGRHGAAPALGGGADRVELPSLGRFYEMAFTLQAWIKPDGSPRDAGIVGTWNPGSGGRCCGSTTSRARTR
jgi:hypothetical protein